ncbi:hypothetical protein D3C86_1824660 [compost metagenome]
MEAHLRCISRDSMQDRQFTGMKLRFQAPVVKNEFIAQYMVNMAMGIQEQNGLQVIFFNETNQPILFLSIIHSRIYNHTFQRLIE